MHIVLLSGGSGKRLWPLSNDIRSKQFIPLFPQVDGEYISMAQRVFRQIRKVDKSADITVATSKSQVSTLKNQLGDNVDISVEPYNGPLFKTTLKNFKRVMQYWQKFHNKLRLEPCSPAIYGSGLCYSHGHSHLSAAAVPGAKYIHSDI